MNDQSGFSLVEIMIVVAIIALLSAIAVPNLIRGKTTANHAAAQAALKSVSIALENYAATQTVYPTDINVLATATPPYLNDDYFSGTHQGYIYTAVLTDYTYFITATPQTTNMGTSTFTMTTGGVLTAN